MNRKKLGLAIIFHSGSYDKLYHGLSLALAALALGREVKFFFTYWALQYLKRKNPASFKLDKEGEAHKKLLEDNLKKGHLQKISDLIIQTRQMGAKFYTCTSSMSLLNIARNELSEIVDSSMGITTFLTATRNDQILFI